MKEFATVLYTLPGGCEFSVNKSNCDKFKETDESKLLSCMEYAEEKENALQKAIRSCLEEAE